MPIFDCRLRMDIGTSCHTTFSIDNRQSAIGNENLVFGRGYAAANSSGWCSVAYLTMARRLSGEVMGDTSQPQPTMWNRPQVLWHRREASYTSCGVPSSISVIVETLPRITRSGPKLARAASRLVGESSSKI